MARKMLIDATHAEETRVVVVNGNKVEEFEFDSAVRSQITGNIYLAKVARVEPSLQAAFVDYGGNRHGFLAFAEIHPDYYQIPKEDRDAILAEDAERERAAEEAVDAQAEKTERKSEPTRKRRTQFGYRKDRNDKNANDDNVVPAEADDETPSLIVTSGEDTDNKDKKPVRSKSRRRRRPSSQAASVEDSSDVTRSDPTDILGDPRGDDLSDEENDKDQGHSQNDSSDIKTSSSDVTDPPSDIEKVKEDDDDETDEVIRDDQKRRQTRSVRRYKIQEVVKVRQILLVQVLKEERGNKGAALTTYLSLPGRYCVLMPNTARGGGISRKISSPQDRRRLKEIASDLNIPQGAGLIIRTAGAKQEAAEIQRDYQYLTRQWSQIRELTLRSVAPAPIYAESGPIKRAIRDLLTRDIDEILVEGEEGYNEARTYTELLMPDLVKTVKHYSDPMPLFSRYQVESLLSAMFNPVVQLKSGGYLVFGVTEALVAVDVNSGRSTKESSIEKTALKTNLEAAEEVARQLKLRDLAGLIVIDFIDMDQRRNHIEVENKLKDSLKGDRARIQVGRISSFGLMEMSRQRLRSGLVEMITQPCPHCMGTGTIRSDDSIALSVLRAIEEEIYRNKSRELVVKAPFDIANFLFNDKRQHLQALEARSGVVIRVEASPEMQSPNFEIEKLTEQTRAPAAPELVTIDNAVVSAAEVVEDVTTTPATPQNPTADDDSDDSGKKKKRRRSRRRGKKRDDQEQNGDQNNSQSNDQDNDQEQNNDETAVDVVHAEASGDDKSSRQRTPRRKRNEPKAARVEVQAEPVEPEIEVKKRPRRTKPEIEADKSAKAAEKVARDALKALKKVEADTKKAQTALNKADDDTRDTAKSTVQSLQSDLKDAQKAQKAAEKAAVSLRATSDQIHSEAESAYIASARAKAEAARAREAKAPAAQEPTQTEPQLETKSVSRRPSRSRSRKPSKQDTTATITETIQAEPEQAQAVTGESAIETSQPAQTTDEKSVSEKPVETAKADKNLVAEIPSEPVSENSNDDAPEEPEDEAPKKRRTGWWTF